MPLSLRPGKPLEFSLETDADLPIDQRPVFLSESKSVEDAREIDQSLLKIEQSLLAVKDVDVDGYRQHAELLASLLTGWRNMDGVEYKQGDVDQLESLLSFFEMIELIRKIQNGQSTSPEEKKS